MKVGFVTSAEVAKRAGVSRSAVSRTFTPGAYVSQQVREKVLKAAEELGYRVNRLAKELHTSRSSMVAIVGANLAEPFIAAQLDALSAALIERGLQTLLLNAGAQDMTALMNLVLEYRVRAVIVLSGAPAREIIEHCRRSDQHMILINRDMADVNADTIETDDVAGGRLAAEHLLGIGCRRLGAIRSGADTPSQRRRARGFLDQVRQTGLPVLEWTEGEGNYEAGAMAAQALLADRKIDGAFCVTDRVALGFLNAARFELGMTVPGDVAIIGFDDIAEAAWPSHALTTISQPVSAFVEAVMLMLDHQDQQKDGTLKRSIDVTLVKRSTA
jgi:DNA-binding LacI/PurR family transcriptional regulator